MIPSILSHWIFIANALFLASLRPQAYAAPSPTYRQTSANTSTHTPLSDAVAAAKTTGYVQMAYFADWAIYDGDFSCTDIDPANITHILYSYANIHPETGTIYLNDPNADEIQHFGNESWSDAGNNHNRCLHQLFLLKLKHRNLTLLLSVGGTESKGSFLFLNNPTSRTEFVKSAVQFIKDDGFDGLQVDIDMEFPETAAESQNLAELFSSLRGTFDTLANDGQEYLLTAAVSAGMDNSAHLDVPSMDRVLDYWNIMAYNYSGSWTDHAYDQANLYNIPRSASSISTDAAVQRYISNGATRSKIVVGIPLYGRSFEGTGCIGQAYTTVGANGGTIPYKHLPEQGAKVKEDMVIVSSYSYDFDSKQLVSYDTPSIVQKKAE
ncbi:glycoside hydrolase family 18 protein [Mycena rebaudengoi]|nr:glycoside hydrolase family 18 protein [Mycena rebaudengoi]